jgi:hypothetical protein
MSAGFDLTVLDGLRQNPNTPVKGRLYGANYVARIAIPDYAARLEQHYDRRLDTLDVKLPFRHFGLTVKFETPVEFALHDEERRLDSGLRALLNRYGSLTFTNAVMPNHVRTSEQRNVFKSLSFHTDRTQAQGDTITMFWRDPTDPVQREPRTSSTLILANAAAYLQAIKEGAEEGEFKLLYQLFDRVKIQPPLVGDVMIELGWRAPTGVGEISLIDNLTTLHASYYPHRADKGYPISVRYLY